MDPMMIQGTGSECGKTTLVAGLCRLLANRGLRVAPFKSQNMSLNCYVTDDGEEIARSTVVQATGARERAIVHMNPILLKPKADDVSQLIVHGRPVRDVSAQEYFLSDRLQELKLRAIGESISYLRDRFDVIIAEGAGSCAEPNLRKFDVVNMGLAEILGARVYVVADIDKGGAFASLLGSVRVMELTAPCDISRIRGFLLNKFRGDRAVLQPAIEFIEAQTGIPVAGVLPHLHGLTLEEEDRLKERFCDRPEVDIAIVYLPHIANAGDFDALTVEEGVQVRYVKGQRDFGVPDAVIIPGTKNTIWDLDYLRRTGFEEVVRRESCRVPVFGVCGGYEMLGRTLFDPGAIESDLGTVSGMGLLDVDVHFHQEKRVTKGVYTPTPHNPFAAAGSVEGYEIHCGVVRRAGCQPLYVHPGGEDGAVHPDRPIFGTFIHDLFNNASFTRTFINFLRSRKHLGPLVGPLPDRAARADEMYDKLAATLEVHTSF